MTEGKKPGRPPERLTVIVYFKMAFGTEPKAETTTWPKNWPLPAQNDMVRIGENIGFVTYIEYAPQLNRLTIYTR